MEASQTVTPRNRADAQLLAPRNVQVEAAGKLPLAEMQSEVKALTQTVSGEGGIAGAGQGAAL